MSDQQPQPTFEEALINRLATRLGVAAAQIEALQLQLEQANVEIERLRTDPAEPSMNGERQDQHEGVMP